MRYSERLQLSKYHGNEHIIGHKFCHDLKDMIGGNTWAFGINNNGNVVGFVSAGGAYLYENEDMRLIGTFPDRTRHNTTRDINDFRQVVGFYDNGSAYVPFIWENENTTFLPLIYERDTRAYAINNSGQVVGKGVVESGGTRGLLWDNGNVYDLSDLISVNSGLKIVEALDINDAGQIVGRGVIGGEEHAVILTPITVPTIDDILSFFDASVADGTLTGDGHGNSANGRLNALRNMLEMAGDLINVGDIDGACEQLRAALRKCDGASPPPDFVTGEAATGLYDMILELITELGCE